MNKTRVDDMLIEMISPKISEINEKFSKGETLTQDDINTLLLKSQYNHINHLDDKLNETVEAVKNLEFKFDKLEQHYKNDFESLEQQYKSDFIKLEQQYKSDFENLELKFDNLRKDFDNLKKDFENLKKDFSNLETKIEATIQKTLNQNINKLIIVVGVFFTIFKIIELFKG